MAGFMKLTMPVAQIEKIWPWTGRVSGFGAIVFTLATGSGLPGAYTCPRMTT
jgi:prolyl-tRNA synthetase